jgi:imidazolonepropionase-like amidohydrolase
LGTLEPGRWADLIVLGANPLSDIRNTRSIEAVYIGGLRVQR